MSAVVSARSCRVPGPAAVSVGRCGLLLAVIVALVAGVMSGVAHAADPGDFTPVDFSQADPAPAPRNFTIDPSTVGQGSVPINGDLGSFSLVLQGLVPPYIPPVRQPELGVAHLFDRYSGLVPMSNDQYAGMVAMENDAVAAVMNLHGISNTPYNHDLVIRYARDDTTAALFARLQQALNHATRTPSEQSALSWLTAVAQAHAVGVAQEARHQFDLWSSNHCTYRPPAPFRDEYDISASWGCLYRPLPGAIPQQDPSPDASQFARWGAAAYDAAHGTSTTKSLFAVSVSEVAIAFAAAGAVFGVSTAAFATAANLLPSTTIGVNGLVNAVAPFLAGQLSSTLANLQANLAEYGTSWVTTAISGISRFAGVLNFVSVVGPGLVLAGALVQLVMAGIQAFSAKNAQRDLDNAVDRATTTTPDLQNLMSTDSGTQQVFYDLVGAVADCSPDNLIARSLACSFEAEADHPQRRANDPVFSTTDLDTGQRAPGVAADVPVSLGTPGHLGDTTLSIRDGWFVIGSDRDPQQTLRYVDDTGVLRTLRLIYNPAGGYFFQSLITPTGDTMQGTGYDPATSVCSSNDVHGTCWVGSFLPMTTTDGRHVRIAITRDLAPTGEAVTVNGSPRVGVPISFTSTLPAGQPADPDGDQVTGSWTVELDQPCVKAAVNTYDWYCHNTGTPDGPHGGYLEQLPAGTNTVVWNAPGTYRVSRIVTDPSGISTSTSVDVTVAPAPRTLFAACLQCDTTGGRQVRIAGRISAGAHRDGEAVTIDWGDGTTETEVPSLANPGNGFLSSTFWARIENSTQYQFQAVHTYAEGTGADRQITVSDTDSGDGDSPPVTLSADTAPVADPTSYGDIVSDRLVDYAIPVRLPLFVDSSGNRLTPTCTAPDGYGTGRTEDVTAMTPFRTGVTVLVTCTATAASGLSSTVTFSVTTHQITATVVPSAASTPAGVPVTFTVRGTTDDGRDVGDITDRVTLQPTLAEVRCALNVCSRTSSSGPISVVPIADDNRVGDPVSATVTPGGPSAITVDAAGTANVPINSPVPTPRQLVVRDQYGNPVPDTTVQLSVVKGAGTLTGGVTSLQVQSDASGRVQLGGSVGGAAGPVVFQAAVNGKLKAKYTVTAVSGDGLRGVAGNAQRVRVGATPTPLTTRVVQGGPVQGQAVRLSVIRGPARFAGGTTVVTGTTGTDGRYSAPLAKAATPGMTVFLVTAGDLTMLQEVSFLPNSAPVTTADAYTVTGRAGPLQITAANGVLRNDADPDGDAVATVVGARPRHGSVVLGRNGSFVYTPTDGYSGTDTFTYSASDGVLTAAPQTVTLTVLPPSADVAVVRSIPASVARGSTFTLGVVVTDYGPSAARAVVVTTTLPAGMTFGAVPARVTLSTDRRTATYAVSGVDVGARTRTDLPVVVAADAALKTVTTKSTASAPTTPDINTANNSQTSRTVVTR